MNYSVTGNSLHNKTIPILIKESVQCVAKENQIHAHIHTHALFAVCRYVTQTVTEEHPQVKN